MEKKEIGIIIKNARIKKGFTQTQIAKKLKKKKSLVCDWEHGRREPTGNTMIKIMQILNLKPTNFIEQREES